MKVLLNTLFIAGMILLFPISFIAASGSQPYSAMAIGADAIILIGLILLYRRPLVKEGSAGKLMQDIFK